MIPAARPKNRQSTADLLLAWYDRHRRHLPWRALPGQVANPYHVWLSEIMLQQTTVVTVKPYFESFLKRWPAVAGLAAASLDDVLHAWQGLGYYARARNLHKCARHVAAELEGRFPDTEAGLRELPGIGPYTAAAIAAIAFDRKATVVDGNVERVMARYHAVETPLPDAKPALRLLADDLTPARRCGDYAQAVMDLGATICTPRNPKCALCPLAGDCTGRAAGVEADLPRRKPKAPKPTRRGVVFWLQRPDGAVYLRRREERGLLGGMMEFPSTAWRQEDWTTDTALAARPAGFPPDDWRPLEGLVRHTFTHFHLELTVLVAESTGEDLSGGPWLPPDRFGEAALPSIMKKVARHALTAGADLPSGPEKGLARAEPSKKTGI